MINVIRSSAANSDGIQHTGTDGIRDRCNLITYCKTVTAIDHTGLTAYEINNNLLKCQNNNHLKCQKIIFSCESLVKHLRETPPKSVFVDGSIWMLLVEHVDFLFPLFLAGPNTPTSNDCTACVVFQCCFPSSI